jgi:hypothetical protein
MKTKMKHLDFIEMLALVVLIGCTEKKSNSTTQVSTESFSVEQVHTCSERVYMQQYISPVSLAIVIVNDISGSYRVSLESLNFNVLYQGMSACPGRVVLGYTHIDEDSKSAIVRFSHTPRLLIETPLKNNERTNPWIQSEAKTETETDNVISRQANTTIDSLNSVSWTEFTNRAEKMLTRNIAIKSNVAIALKRASMFLNEFSNCPKIMIVCSDFLDTYGNTMNIDSSISLYVAGGNIEKNNVTAVTGSANYTPFESYEEALNLIVKYMYNSKK